MHSSLYKEHLEKKLLTMRAKWDSKYATRIEVRHGARVLLGIPCILHSMWVIDLLSSSMTLRRLGRHTVLRTEPMDRVELSTKFLAEAMFEQLDLPTPVYFTRAVEQGGYVSDVGFYSTEENLPALPERTYLSSDVCKDGETSMDHAVALDIRFMEHKEHKVLIDYNYEKLQKEEKANEDITEKLLQKQEEIMQHKKTIKQMTREASDFIEEARITSNQIHDLLELP